LLYLVLANREAVDDERVIAALGTMWRVQQSAADGGRRSVRAMRGTAIWYLLTSYLGEKVELY
jgi:hypothetical protein